MKDRLEEQAEIAVLEAKVREQAAVIAELEARLKEMQATEAARPKYHPGILEQAERIVQEIEAKRDELRKKFDWRELFKSKSEAESGDAAPELNLKFK